MKYQNRNVCYDEHSYEIIFTCADAFRQNAKSINVLSRRQPATTQIHRLCTTFVDDFSHIKCQLINAHTHEEKKRKQKLEIVSAALNRASKYLQTEINRCEKKKKKSSDVVDDDDSDGYLRIERNHMTYVWKRRHSESHYNFLGSMEMIPTLLWQKK